MCGIIGATGKKPDVTELRYLIYLNQHRGGWDGQGIWTNKQGLKKGFNLDWGMELLKRRKSHKFLIHLRAATSGNISPKFCHPFLKNNIVFCHNGHIENYESFNTPMDSLAGFQIVLNNLKGIENLDGFYVFSWFDNSNNTFHLLNNCGQIQFGWRKNTLYFASTGVEKILNRTNFCPNYTHLIFNSENGELKSIKKLEKLLQKKRGFWSNFSENYEELEYV